MDPQTYSFLASFTESERKTLKLISEYLTLSGKRCFTYRGLRGYYSVNKWYVDIEWHTVERVIRKLAERGLFDRIIKKRHAIFCLTKDLEHKLINAGWLSWGGVSG